MYLMMYRQTYVRTENYIFVVFQNKIIILYIIIYIIYSKQKWSTKIFEIYKKFNSKLIWWKGKRQKRQDFDLISKCHKIVSQ